MKNNHKILLLVILILLISAYFLRAWIPRDEDTGSAELSWTANTESDIAGYKIYYGEKKKTGDCPPGGYPDMIDAKNSNQQKIDGLKRGKTYFFSITSYDKSGQESCFSEEGEKTIPLGRWGKAGLILSKIIGR